MRRRSLYAWSRYIRFLAFEFRWPATVFAALVLLGGLGLMLTYGDAELGYAQACYAVFCMIFFETGVVAFPKAWYLQPFFFIVPLVGLGAVADSVVRLGYFLVTKKQKLPEWNQMNASLMRNHVVLCGLGKVGYRVAELLMSMREDFVAIEKAQEGLLATDMLDRGVPIIFGDCRLRKTLEAANVGAARAVILATDDDLSNIDAALTAREMKPDVRVVLRLFDETLASKVATAFHMPAISTAARAASAFVAAATERNIFQSFELCGQELHVADVLIRPGAKIAGKTIGDVQDACKINVVMHANDGKPTVNPAHDVVLEEGDQIIVIAPLDCIMLLQDQSK